MRLSILLPLLLSPLFACSSTPDGSLPITADLNIQGWAVFDGNVFVGKGIGTATVYSKVTGMPLYSVELPGTDKFLVARLDPKTSLTLPGDSLLPSWARGPFAAGADERYEVRFQEDLPPEPEPDPVSSSSPPSQGVEPQHLGPLAEA